jgi:AraC family transcriptional regulator, regulatory protein of adaptative response / methylated-DNA-[protein]-cysteine methyltransferase
MLDRPGQTPFETNHARARIACSIRHLVENYDAQPSLEDAARAAGLSPYHFQREFSRLAGVSPKAFIGHLTLEHAKAKLAGGASVLHAALDAGLSGPSRLYDLCLKVESMTPGDYAKGGAGLLIRYGFHATLLGTALLMATERGLCGLAFADEGDEDAALADMRARWPRAELVHDASAIAPYAAQIFHPQGDARARKNGEIPIQLFGTPWQIKVWQALLAIPEGDVVSYRTIAERVCTARASRATGAAIGRNPIALLIPCHRVLASSGAITGYHWGAPRKRALLALEAARATAA